MRKNNYKEALWNQQVSALRDPMHVLTGSYADNGIVAKALHYTVSDSFVSLLEKMNITLLLSREYEHLVLALTATKKTLKQSFFHIPHPSGLVVDRKRNSVYIASTRNPNSIWELKPMKSLLLRNDESHEIVNEPFLMLARSKYYAGAYYYHDLAMIGDDLYANSVGQNGIVKVNFNEPQSDQLVWWPKSVERKDGSVNSAANYIQLNSIAAGNNIEESFFSASSSVIAHRRPGHRNYPVDKRGVIFSGKTREVIGKGLTRPHSARLYDKKIWVANSGYGEVGYIDKGKFLSTLKLPGWTRGICFYKNILLVGVSRVLPRFKKYAPGLDLKFQSCGIYAIDVKKTQIIGSIIWPYGSQIFAIDFFDSSVSKGFMFESVKGTTKKQKNIFYRFQL